MTFCLKLIRIVTRVDFRHVYSMIICIGRKVKDVSVNCVSGGVICLARTDSI